MAGTIHLVGIGGVGMSALAQAYLDAGHAVSGADRSLRADGSRTPVLDALAAEGVEKLDFTAALRRVLALWPGILSPALPQPRP